MSLTPEEIKAKYEERVKGTVPVKPDIVRKWIGHKTEKTMRPYKGITERARKAAMPAIEQFDVFSENK